MIKSLDLVNKCIGVKRGIIEIEFNENIRKIKCSIPDDQLWGAIKDVLLLDEYEMFDDFKINKSKDKVVADAGAHVGLFSLRASVYAKKVISLEPHPLLYKLLENNVIRNNIKNIHPLNLALWKEKGVASFVIGEHSGGNRVVETKNANSKMKIQTITLSDLVESYGKIDLLKIDIEGSEFDVLLNAPGDTLNNIDKIVGEMHLWEKGFSVISRVTKKLEESGFEVKVLKPPIFYYRYSMSKLFHNYMKIKGVHRLKWFLFISYTGTNILRVLKVIGSNKFNSLYFLYAWRD